MRNYKKIQAFQLADEFVSALYTITKSFPKEEVYGLTSQLRRAAVSVPANIVEGSSRQHKKDYLNFLYISRASLAETEYLLYLSCKLGYIEQKVFTKLENTKQEVAKTLFGLISSVEREIK